MRGAEGKEGGETPAWQPFLKGLRGFLARRLPAQEVEDVLQEVMVRLHQGASSLRESSRAEAWVYAIARRAVADFYRSRAADMEHQGPDEGKEPVAPAGPQGGFGRFPGGHSVHEEVLSWLEPMARSLPIRYSEPLLLADFKGLRQAEVARRLGLTLSGAKSRIQRARKLLRRELRRCCEIHLSPEGEVVDFRRRDCDC